MKATVFTEPGKVEIKEIEKPSLQTPKDALIKVVRACVCGSDLWWFRGIGDRKHGGQVGHEAIGVVEEVGADVKEIKVGDFVIVPFTNGCGKCVNCRAGYDGNCIAKDRRDVTGYQAEYINYNQADGGLVKIPGKPEDYTEDQLKDLLTLSDVMATGYHAAASALVKEGDTVAVIGDGAVGLSAVIAAKLRGAKKIISLSHHEDRAQLAREFGATDIVSSRGDQAVKDVLALTEDGAGADAVLECVGAESAIEQAGQIAHAGAIIGRVGVPQKEPSANSLLWKNVGLRGGLASVTTYDKQVLLDAVLKGEIHPGKVFTQSYKLDDVQQAYEAMDQRKAIKAMLVID
ncbi:S-(hydroxymethyl)glutathione dehydrogenase [Ligilactobacillus hayakitensis DSM 18933 = JCM 14209]|uniref:S-(Hydroxymethyl)glutathione dehydrogenase n=1 Tax=Ligilactobacillus hayakitensis DSM 18933 = JCM 14209 TaxID=1423755 RepID=A0A0R1WQN0_9LACO|nr:Zn-dependent alcohol dehydrogenase [Ligilactobacillus hayakitensis]KRM20176.1 S-(hydroxymethyl)glutathione dehydrogenase [Ligilactobacillus hayakitensis DSM 18933 = JCM 14209]